MNKKINNNNTQSEILQAKSQPPPPPPQPQQQQQQPSSFLAIPPSIPASSPASISQDAPATSVTAAGVLDPMNSAAVTANNNLDNKPNNGGIGGEVSINHSLSPSSLHPPFPFSFHTAL
jgi:hypothetical protein